jgi:NAD(P)H-hydrate epimerase
MAVGGSGDVLAGIIVSLLGQGLRPVRAAACGAWLHGAAGDKAADRLGQYGMLPTDMLICLPRLLK